MPQVNEQLDKLWGGSLPDETRENADQLKRGLIAMEKGNGIENAGVHQTDNSVVDAMNNVKWPNL